MSSEKYCTGCDSFAFSTLDDGKCMDCGTLTNTILTYEECCKLRYACDWLVDHSKGPAWNQPLNYVQTFFEADECLKSGSGAWSRGSKLWDLAKTMYVDNVSPAEAVKNVNDVMKWRLSYFPIQISLGARACLYALRGWNDKYSSVFSYLQYLV